MTQEPKPPRNRDQVLPLRKGDTIDSQSPPERDEKERKKDAPLPEEESYERESPTRRNTDEERIAGE